MKKNVGKIKQVVQQSLRWADRTAYRRRAFEFPSRKESDFPEWLQSHTRYGDAAISNDTFNSKIRCGNLVHVRVTDARDKCALEIAAKPLQIKS